MKAMAADAAAAAVIENVHGRSRWGRLVEFPDQCQEECPEARCVLVSSFDMELRGTDLPVRVAKWGASVRFCRMNADAAQASEMRLLPVEEHLVDLWCVALDHASWRRTSGWRSIVEVECVATLGAEQNEYLLRVSRLTRILAEKVRETVHGDFRGG